MINKLAKAQKGWGAKLILSLTALSFMSLFGVSGYLSSAGSNRTVIKVDNIEISQSEFYYRTQNELAIAKSLIGEDQELTEEMRIAIIYRLAQKMLTDSVLDRTADKYNIMFNPEFINNVIFSDPSFKDASGNFSREVFSEILSKSGLSQNEYVKSVNRNMVRRLLVDGQVLNINVPEVLLKAQAKVDNKRRTFKYVNIKASDMNIDRTISEEETNQYYTDFSANFMEPERRNLSVLYIPMQNIFDNIKVSDEDIKFYYDENTSDYETPEKRQVLQMMFDSQETTSNAYAALQNGKSFYDVASEFANQSKEDTDLGFVSAEELLPELSSEVFAINKGEYTAPIKVGEVWQIAKVEDVEAGSKTDYATASMEIEKILKDERLYDESYEILTSIEDKLAAGTDMETVSQEVNATVYKVEGMAEDNTGLNVPEELKELVKEQEFIDAAFSYVAGEVSQVIEVKDGLMVVRIDEVNEAHPKALETVKDEIVQLWSDNERSAIANEKLNDVMHDLENGDEFSEVANRYGLEVYKSRPITRNETFADIPYNEVREMFTESLNTPRQIQIGSDYVVAVALEDYNNMVEATKEEKDLVKRKAYNSLNNDFVNALLKSYSDEYKIRMKYKLMGLTDL